MTAITGAASDNPADLVSLTTDQEMYRDTAARFAREVHPISQVRASYGQPPDREYLRRTGELGWYASFVPETFGGGAVSGHPLRDAVVLSDVLGRNLQPAPVVGTSVSAHAVDAWGSHELCAELLPQLAAGEASAALVFADEAHCWDRRGGITATRPAGQVILDGVAACVPGLIDARWAIVTADSADGLVHAVVDTSTQGVSIEPLDGLDGARPCASLHLRRVPVDEQAVLATPSSGVDESFELAVVLLVNETVGAMRQMFEATVDYAKSRVAFGRPIGSFQAIKHMLADASMLIELSCAIAHEAAVSADARQDDAAEIASVAKAYVSDAAITVSQACLQVHGGVGYTWEHDLHLYMRRLASDAILLGDASWHRARLWSVTGSSSRSVG